VKRGKGVTGLKRSQLKKWGKGNRRPTAVSIESENGGESSRRTARQKTDQLDGRAAQASREEKEND